MTKQHSISILLVDDQPANLSVLEAVLAELGEDLVSVSSGEQALGQLLEREFAVVLLDVQMPTMSGFETAAMIRNHPRARNVPIIFMTAADDLNFPADQAYALGAVDFLIRPFNPVVLRAKVAVFIDLYRKNAELARRAQARHEAALKTRDQRIRLILDNTRDYAFIGTDVARVVTEWEGGAAAITGWDAASALGQSSDMLFTAEDRERGMPEAEMVRARDSGRAEDKRWHMRRDGSCFFADGVMVPLRDEAGLLLGYAKIFRDATAERLAAEQLAHSEAQLSHSMERFSLLLESSGEGIYGIAPDGNCSFLNAAGAAMLGYQPQELVGRELHAVIHHHRADGAPYPLAECRLARAAREGRPLRVDDEVFWRRDGTPVPVFYSVYPMVIGGQTAGAVVTFSDISGRREAEAERERLYKEVEAASARLADIFQRAPAFMCVMRGPQHVFEIANQRFVELVGARDLIGKPVRAAIPEVEGQGFFELLDSVYRSGQPVEGSNVRLLLQRDGGALLEERYVDFVYMALRDPEGGVSGVLVHGVDVTERTRNSVLSAGQRGALELAVSDAPLGDVLDVLARSAEDYMGSAGLAAIELVEADGVHLRHAAAPSLPADYVAALDALGPGPGRGPGGSALATAQTVTVTDIAAQPGSERWRELALAHGLRACCSMPILSPAGAVLGTFTWYFHQPRAPLAHEHEALALLANTASLVIGQRHEAQQRKAAEDRAHDILESISEGFLAIDADCRVSYANRAAEQVTGRHREELEGEVFWDVLPAALGTAIEDGHRRTASERVPVKFDAFYDPSGRWYEINSFPTPDGGTALYFRDETERRLAEEGIRRLAAVAEQSPDFIGITSAEAVGVFLNPAGRRMAGIGPEADITAYSMIDFFAPDSRQFVLDVVLPALRGGPARWEGELGFFNHASQSEIPVYFKGFAVRDDNGNIIGLATVTRDISEQKRAEDELRRVAADLNEADHRKSEFLATLAHELRNPLAPIRTGLDLIRMAPGDAAAMARVHDMMDRQLGHLIHLVNDLLDVARITRGKIELKKEMVELKTLVSMAVETSTALIEASGHALQVRLPDEPVALDVDATRIVQVLSNLLNNAAKYTPAGGRITLSAWREGTQVAVAVADTGVGIPPEALGTLFDMFTQVRSNIDRAQGGLGIGLSLVRRLVELHGGSVEVASRGRGEGSTFTVRLPLPSAGSAAGAAPPQESAGSAPKSLRVLVVDDNADAAHSLAALLARLGHSSQVAFDGRQGFMLAQDFKPDLVFLDIGLPGMNGHEVARAIRATPGMQHVILIALTGWGARSDLNLSQQAGFDQHLTKPVSFESLERAFAAATGGGA